MLKVSLQEFALKVNQPDKTERNIRGAARSGARLRSGESGAKKIGLFVLILLLCLQLSSRAEAARPELNAFSQNVRQDKSVTPAREPGILKSDSLSPYVIEWYLDMSEHADLNYLWQLLKMKSYAERPDRCGGDCAAETFDIKTGDEEGEIVALKVSFASLGFYEYLIFRKSRSLSDVKDEWIFLGNIDSPGQRDAPPEHRIESGSDRTWFVLRELWSRESSTFKARGEKWYEIKEGGIKQVLYFPVEGREKICDAHLDRSYTTILLRHGLEDGVYTVPVQFLVSYGICDCTRSNESHALFGKGQKASYVWNGEKDRFVLDASRSDITEKDIGSLYGVEGLNEAIFVEYNFDELSAIATDGDSKQKEWLKKFVGGRGDSSRKEALRRMLRP